MGDLRDKRVLVTGASQGLGAVCAVALAERGARLVLTARTTQKLEELRASLSQPDRHLTFAADLLSKEGVRAVAEKTLEFLSGVDVILHVAGGGLGLRDPLLDWDGLMRLYTLNVVAGAELNRLLLPDMITCGRGNIVHVCSIASQEATASVGYNTAKAALAAYVRSLGRELAATGVIVTGLMPGAFWAPGNSWDRLNAKKPEVVEKFIQERLPRKRIGNAQELIPLILLLCSEDASMASGCCVPIDAGEGLAYLS